MRADREYRVLIIEDSPDDEALSCRGVLLERPGAQISVARTATEALLWLATDGAKGGADLILLDLRIPPCGGMEFLRSLRTSADMPPLPVIVFGSSVHSQTVHEAYSLGANAVNEKHVEPSEYMLRVRAAVAFFCGLATLPDPSEAHPGSFVTVR